MHTYSDFMACDYIMSDTPWRCQDLNSDLTSGLCDYNKIDCIDGGGPCGVMLKDISVFPGEEEYSEAIEVYNQAYAQSKPAFVAFPITEEDVMRCLQCATTYSVPCVVKSGKNISNAKPL